MKKRVVLVISIIILLIISFFAFKYFIPNKVNEVTNSQYVSEKFVLNDQINQTNKASMLVNLQTNQIIYANNVNQVQPVYSVSKVMFLATVAEKMKEDNISYDKKVVVPKIINKVNKNGNFSRANLKANEVYTIKELFDGTMIPSGNDATIVLAIEIFGSHENAVQAMNDNVKKWGLKHSSFISTSGLDGEYLREVGVPAKSGKNLMSAYDSVILVQLVMANYPEIVDSGSKIHETIGKKNEIASVNEILDGLDYGYNGVYGLKTGSNIEEYSNCIMALKKNEQNQDILAIAYSAKTRASLYGDVAKMYDYLKTLELNNLQDKIQLNTKVGFSENEVSFQLEQPFYLYQHPNQTLEYRLVNKTKYNKSLNRFYNVKSNDKLGQLEIIDENVFFNNEPLNLSYVVAGEVKAKNIFSNIKEFVGELIAK